jgi:hypothetical protein
MGRSKEWNDSFLLSEFFAAAEVANIEQPKVQAGLLYGFGGTDL